MSTTINDFHKIDMRVGRIINVHDFPEANKPSYILTIDFGPAFGFKKSSAQITELYTKDQLMDRLIIAVVNLPPKQIAHFFSEVLVLGVHNEHGQVVLLEPDVDVPVGGRVY